MQSECKLELPMFRHKNEWTGHEFCKERRTDGQTNGRTSGYYYISSSLTSFNFKLAMQKCLRKHGKVELKNCRQIFII